MIVVSGTPKAGNGATKRGNPLRVDRRVAPALRKEIYASLGSIADEVSGLTEWLAGTASVSEANVVLRQLQDKWRDLYGPKADDMARRMTTALSANSKRSLETSVARALRVDVAKIVDDETVRRALELGAADTAGLIKSIPAEYLADVEKAVLQNYMQIPFPDGRTLAQHLEHLYGLSKTRATFISRDQASKVNTLIVQARDLEIGIEAYIWRNMQDNRVVGKPGGLFPKPTAGHGNHWEREGKVYRWDNPPYDGPPGWPYNCRCYSEPVIVPDKLKFV